MVKVFITANPLSFMKQYFSGSLPVPFMAEGAGSLMLFSHSSRPQRESCSLPEPVIGTENSLSPQAYLCHRKACFAELSPGNGIVYFSHKVLLDETGRELTLLCDINKYDLPVYQWQVA
jgi:hypothetical protein